MILAQGKDICQKSGDQSCDINKDESCETRGVVPDTKLSICTKCSEEHGNICFKGKYSEIIGRPNIYNPTTAPSGAPQDGELLCDNYWCNAKTSSPSTEQICVPSPFFCAKCDDQCKIDYNTKSSDLIDIKNNVSCGCKKDWCIYGNDPTIFPWHEDACPTGSWKIDPHEYCTEPYDCPGFFPGSESNWIFPGVSRSVGDIYDPKYPDVYFTKTDEQTSPSVFPYYPTIPWPFKQWGQTGIDIKRQSGNYSNALCFSDDSQDPDSKQLINLPKMGTACCRSNQDDNCKLSCYDLSIFQRWYDCKDRVKNSAKNIDDVLRHTSSPTEVDMSHIAPRGTDCENPDDCCEENLLQIPNIRKCTCRNGKKCTKHESPSSSTMWQESCCTDNEDGYGIDCWAFGDDYDVNGWRKAMELGFLKDSDGIPIQADHGWTNTENGGGVFNWHEDANAGNISCRDQIYNIWKKYWEKYDCDTYMKKNPYSKEALQCRAGGITLSDGTPWSKIWFPDNKDGKDLDATYESISKVWDATGAARSVVARSIREPTEIATKRLYGICKQPVIGENTWEEAKDNSGNNIPCQHNSDCNEEKSQKCQADMCGSAIGNDAGNSCDSDSECKSCWCKPRSFPCAASSNCKSGTCQDRFKNIDDIITYCSIPLCNDPAQSESAQLPMYTKASSTYYNYSKLLRAPSSTGPKFFPNTLSPLRKQIMDSPSSNSHALKQELMIGHPSTAFGMVGGSILRENTTKVWGTNGNKLENTVNGENVGILDFNPLRVNRTNKFGEGINPAAAYMKPTHGYYLRWKLPQDSKVTTIFDKVEIPFLPDQGWNFRPEFSPSSSSSGYEWEAVMPSYDKKWNPAFLTSKYMQPGAAASGLNKPFPISGPASSDSYAYGGKLSTTIDLSSDPCLKVMDKSDETATWLSDDYPDKWNSLEQGVRARKLAEERYPNFRNPRGQAAVDVTFNMSGSRHKEFSRTPDADNRVSGQNKFWREKNNAITMGGIGPVLNKDDSIFYQPLSTVWRNEDTSTTFSHYYPPVNIDSDQKTLWPAWKSPAVFHKQPNEMWGSGISQPITPGGPWFGGGSSTGQIMPICQIIY